MKSGREQEERRRGEETRRGEEKRGEEEEEKEDEKREEKEEDEDEEDEEEATDIKSNNPHLAGGEKHDIMMERPHCWVEQSVLQKLLKPQSHDGTSLSGGHP